MEYAVCVLVNMAVGAQRNKEGISVIAVGLMTASKKGRDLRERGSDRDLVTSVIFNVMHETSEGQLFGTAETGNLTTPVTIGDRQAAFIT